MSHKNSQGDECLLEYAHFVSPGGGTIGFYSCNPPDDLRNHTRCQPPFDHEHEDHSAFLTDPYAAPEEQARRRQARDWAEIKNLGKSRIDTWSATVNAARALLDEAAMHTDPHIGWTGWPAEYAALAHACDWQAPAEWNVNPDGEEDDE